MKDSRRRRRQERLAETARTARRLRGAPPAETLEIGLDMIESSRSLNDAGRAALVRRRRQGR